MCYCSSFIINSFQFLFLFFSVGQHNFTLVMNDQVLATVNDTIGSEEIVKLRFYGGYFTNFFVKPAHSGEFRLKYIVIFFTCSYSFVHHQVF